MSIPRPIQIAAQVWRSVLVASARPSVRLPFAGLAAALLAVLALPGAAAAVVVALPLALPLPLFCAAVARFPAGGESGSGSVVPRLASQALAEAAASFAVVAGLTRPFVWRLVPER